MVMEKKWYEKKLIEPMNKFANLRIIKSISENCFRCQCSVDRFLFINNLYPDVFHSRIKSHSFCS